MPLEIPFVIDRPYGRVECILEVYEEAGERVCGIYKLKGSINLPPKRWLAVIRHEVGVIENIARDANCTEIRMAGRDWSAVLPDYSPYPGPRNGLRKAL